MDNLSPAQRSALMRKIKGSDTEPERIACAELARLGIPYRCQAEDMPGTPDIVLDDRKVAIFIHGCFWHGCPLHYRPPDTRRAWWAAKIERTKRRDKAARLSLEMLGWKVFEV